MNKTQTAQTPKDASRQVKRYALLAGFTYYASPGWTALIGYFDNLEEATNVGRHEAEEEFVGGWFQVIDMQTGEIVAGEGKSHTGLYGEFPANPQKRRLSPRVTNTSVEGVSKS